MAPERYRGLSANVLLREGSGITRSGDVAYTMKVEDLTLICRIVNTNRNITLPPVAEAAGLMYSIILEDTGTGSIVIQDAGDDAKFTNVTLDADGETAVIYSNGVRWITLQNS